MRIPPHVRWPAVIIGALVFHVVASLATVWVATANPSYAVEENYYQKGLAWDDKLAQDRRNASLGWSIELTVQTPSAPGNPATLQLHLTDTDGAPIEGATTAVETFHNARAGRILRAALSAQGSGVYSTTLPMRRTGVWEFRITATRGADIFTYVETRYVSLTPGSVN